MIVALLTSPWWLLAIFAQAAGWCARRAVHNPRLFTALDEIPWPRLRGPRKDSPCTTAASTASTASTTRRTKSRAPKAATTEWQVEPARGRHAMRLERGRDGLLHTGPMQAIPDGYGSLPDTPIDYWPSLYGPARQQQQHGADLAGAVKLAGHAGRGL